MTQQKAETMDDVIARVLFWSAAGLLFVALLAALSVISLMILNVLPFGGPPGWLFAPILLALWLLAGAFIVRIIGTAFRALKSREQSPR